MKLIIVLTLFVVIAIYAIKVVLKVRNEILAKETQHLLKNKSVLINKAKNTNAKYSVVVLFTQKNIESLYPQNKKDTIQSDTYKKFKNEYKFQLN